LRAGVISSVAASSPIGDREAAGSGSLPSQLYLMGPDPRDSLKADGVAAARGNRCPERIAQIDA